MNRLEFEAKYQERQTLKERIPQEGLLPVVKEKLRELVEICDSANSLHKESNGMLQSIIPMVYTLLAENRLEDLYSILVLGFSEYYNFPDTDDNKLEWGGKAYVLKQAIDDGSIMKTLFE